MDSVIINFFDMLGNAPYYVGLLTILYLVYLVTSFLYIYVRPSSFPRYRHGKESWALVTGASDGIGQGFAQELCHRGFNVIIHGRNAKKLDRVKSELVAAYPKAQVRIFVADASEPLSSQSIDELKAIVDGLHLTVLINNVGGSKVLDKAIMTFESQTSDEVSKIVNLNLSFTLQVTHALQPILCRHEPSLIINIGSLASMGLPYICTYGATKAAVLSFASSMDMEMEAEGRNVTVMGVGVGETQTPMNKLAVKLFTPSSRTMAKASLNRVGCGKSVVIAYFPHALQSLSVMAMPEWLIRRTVIPLMREEKTRWDKFT